MIVTEPSPKPYFTTIAEQVTCKEQPVFLGERSSGERYRKVNE